MSIHPLTFVLAITLIVFNVLQSILAQVIAVTETNTNFNLSAVVLSTEILKLFLALPSIFYYTRKTNTSAFPTRSTVFVMAIPALLYTISNTLTYHTIALMGSTNFQILGNIRIVITALLYRLLALRQLLVIQCIALSLLLIGSTIASTSAVPVRDNRDVQFTVNVTSFLYILAQNTCTSLAGVYQELLFKSNDQHFTVKNACLYTWTCIFSALKLQADLSQTAGNIFIGFSHITWLSVVVYGCYGQVVSFTLAYCDNLVKVFATSFAATASLSAEVFMLGQPVQSGQVLGAVIVVISTLLFYLDNTILMKSI